FAIITPLRGSCQVEARDGGGRRRVTLVPGEVCRIAPGEPVRIRRLPPGNPPFELACAQLPTTIFQDVARAHPTSVEEALRPHALKHLDLHLASMVSVLVHARELGAGEDYAVSASRYLANYLLAPRTAEHQGTGGLKLDQLAEVIAYMKENLRENITLDRLAELAAVSRYHFLRRFSESVGETPLQYLIRLRVDAARYQLVADDEPVSQVGKRCGFQSPEHFARVFRKWVGCSPSQYRKRVRREGASASGHQEPDTAC
ncbi:AraC family transcriptional regulator, partial [Actinosynnema sp. NPDC023658]|uniref:AraC family transcriptional regulator n=1 Tax=Actinosynnema sp. NPDC023658 TaxID=3155465 RepID=UPI0033E2F888